MHPSPRAGRLLWKAVLRLDDPRLTADFRREWAAYSWDWAWRDPERGGPGLGTYQQQAQCRP